jgi:hypothetical protein
LINRHRTKVLVNFGLGGWQNVIDMSANRANTRQFTPVDVVDFGPLKEAQAALGLRWRIR